MHRLPTMEFDAIIRSPATKRAEGAQCRKHGLKREDNPHEVGSINHEAWDEGWQDYDRMEKQKNAHRS